MKTAFLIASTVATATAQAHTQPTFFGATDPPACHVTAEGRTVIHYTSTIHPSFKCTHDPGAGTCACVSKHPTHHAGLCQEFSSVGNDPTHTLSGDCTDSGADASEENFSLGYVMEWCGKVNQHKEGTSGDWMTDSDGASGCSSLSTHGWWADPANSSNRKVHQYCKKFWPEANYAVASGTATINTWCNAGNTNCQQSSSKTTYKCAKLASWRLAEQHYQDTNA